MSTEIKRPLEGVVVLEFSQFLAGPVAGLRLSDLGARVIKIEKPEVGDLCRYIYLSDTNLSGDNSLFHAINRNKESFVADLKNSSDLKRIKKLISKADIITQNFRPGVIERIGLDYENVKKINPKIVYGSITGYGNTGPWRDLPGQDLLAQSRSGLVWLNGNGDGAPTPMGLAAADMFDIKIKGIGGHGAAPQGTVDSVIVASHLVQALQTIVSRNTNPLESTVVSIGKINGGHNFNIIADEVSLSGTARAYTEKNRNLIKQRMQEIIDGIAKTYGAEILFKYKDGYPPTINHTEPTKKVLKAAHKVVGDKAGMPYLSMGGEDFAYYLEKVPGCFFFVGSAPNKKELFETPHHCSHFNLDERALLIGSSIYLNILDEIIGV